MTTIAAVADFLKRFAPPRWAASWDNVGLLLGDDAGPVERVLTCLTVTPESAAEAIDERAQLIVAHHPILFRPTQRLTTATAEGRMLLALAKAGVAVYSPHTAFDNTSGGINDVLAERLRLTGVRPLRHEDGPRQCKVAIFVPDADLQRVADAIFAAGAGHIGQYRECSFRLAGTGTFFGGDAANPTVGQKGRREEVSEWRLEALCPEADIDRVVQAMRKAHSYEEPAYDVYPLRPEREHVGGGRIGVLPQTTTLREFARTVQGALHAAQVQVVGDADRQAMTIAVACGAGGEFLADAVQQGADVFLTGEVRFHDCLAAQAQGIALVLPGHYATERCGVEALAGVLARQFPSLTVWPSRREREPLWTA
ncbi:MAG: Nif3-like dinuclear metal center hexameric protein [Gemmataceae bacterium]|nr:Nif3-like dinuclear metal center hexameric protein [Gemmataceae bacterium]